MLWLLVNSWSLWKVFQSEAFLKLHFFMEISQMSSPFQNYYIFIWLWEHLILHKPLKYLQYYLGEVFPVTWVSVDKYGTVITSVKGSCRFLFFLFHFLSYFSYINVVVGIYSVIPMKCWIYAQHTSMHMTNSPC